MGKKKIKTLLKNSKGFRKSNLYKLSKQKYIKALVNKYISRKLKKRFFRAKWIKFISAFLKKNTLHYSLFISSLKKQKISLNRKILFLILVNDIIN